MADKEEYRPDEEPSTEDLQEPSTEKDPGEEPHAPEQKDAEPSHEAVGIGVVEGGSDDDET
ncbi:hypothetical protein [Microbacterium invictum]|uniref:Uncharacterized protein n=1 Tax=Microbacterium invictum TaxID=515415 RepID=A0AA40SQH5_9MICO|nr:MULTISPECIES: hypothetical protein [Microbacterium]MBB4140533.1 hypothetical protein [Microbacterium invictum]